MTTKVWKEAEAAAGSSGYIHPVRVIHDKEKDIYKTIDCQEKILMIDKVEEEFYRNAAKTDRSIHIFDLDEEEFLYFNWDEQKPPTAEELGVILKSLETGLSDRQIRHLFTLHDPEKMERYRKKYAASKTQTVANQRQDDTILE